ncbi:MAG: hypothetical protein ABIV36_16535, partial [Sphingobium limneticum]
ERSEHGSLLSGNLCPSRVRSQWQSTMMKSAERQADAERSLDRILTLFDDTPAKKRAVKKVQKDIASAFSDK